MKPMLLDLTEDFFEKYTTDSTAITGFKYLGKDVPSCIVPNHISGFPQIAVKIYELMYRLASGVDFRKITTTKDKFVLITIKGNSDNSKIFDTFRRFGILTGNLTIALSGTPTSPTVYTTAKMLRDISKFSSDIQIALVALLYNIAKTCGKIIHSNPTITLDPMLCSVDTSLDLKDTVVDFRTMKSITLAELPTEDYTSIEYVHSRYCAAYTTFSAAISYNVLASIKEDAIDFSNSAIISSISFGPTVYPIILYPDGNVHTTMELSQFESARDSYISALVTHYGLKNIKVSKVSFEELVSKMPKESTIVDILDDDNLHEEFISAAPKALVSWHTEAMKTTHENLTEEKVKKLSITLGLKKPVSSSAFDKEAIMELYKDDEYAQQLYKQIKPYYDTFDLGTIAANCKGFAKGDIYSLMFIGDSGTGKSTSARVLPARCGIPYTSINFSVNIEESDIIGSMIPNTMKTTPEEPEFVWQDGVLTRAVRNGYCIILEEINFARPGVLGKLNSLLDENRQIDLPTGEVLIAHPNFRIIATCNVAYEGTNRFNKALINRFEDCTVFKDVDRSKAIEIIKSRTGYKNMVKMDPILNVYEALKKYSKEQNLNLVISMRQLLNIFSNGKYYTNAYDAVLRIMVNGAFIEEPEYQEEFEKSVLPAFKLNYKI